MIENHIMSRSGHEPLNSHYYATHYPSVYAAAERIFGSWCEAIESCGFKYSDIRKYKIWDREKIVAEIKKLAAEGALISSQHIQNTNKSLYMASIHHFKSWGNAIQAAGINYSTVRLRRSMSPYEIKQEIIRLYKEGVDMSYCNVRKNHQYLLAYGMKKLGSGSWAAARRVCGIQTNYRIHPAKRKILKIRETHSLRKQS